MAGILNNKERVLDFTITKEGRKQISSGRMRIEFASLTDRHTFYQATGSQAPDVAEDATNRIFFETAERPQDLIVPELEAGTVMQPFRTEDFIVKGRAIASGTFKTGAVTRANVLTGSQITDIETKFLRTFLNNYRDHKILGTIDLFNDTTDFVLSATTASFAVTDSVIDFNQSSLVDVLNLPNLYSSPRFSHLPNFRYLPPVNKLRPNEQEPTPMGDYPELSSAGSKKFQTWESLHEYLSAKQNLEFGFVDTSRDNNLLVQVFEFDDANNKVEKLSIVDYGEFSDNDPLSPGKHVYFVGRVREDEQGASTFINLLTVVFD